MRTPVYSRSKETCRENQIGAVAVMILHYRQTPETSAYSYNEIWMEKNPLQMV